MPTNVDLKSCSGCGKANFETEIAKNEEIGVDNPVIVPIPQGVRVSMNFEYKDHSTKTVFECMKGTVFPPGTLTVTQSQVL